MRITVVTVVFNGAATLERTIRSVLAQRDVPLEYWIIDGGSTDGTVELIRRYEDRLAGWVSEPDGGIYEAMNKGLSRATGDIVGFLNADDVYAHETVLSRIRSAFTTGPAVDAVYGELVYVDADDHVRRYWRTGPVSPRFFPAGDVPPHPAFFVHRSTLLASGGFRTDLRLAADYELMLRLLHKEGRPARYLPEALVRMRAGGVSNQSGASVLQGLREIRRAWRLYGLTPPPLLLPRLLFRRLWQLQ